MRGGRGHSLLSIWALAALAAASGALPDAVPAALAATPERQATVNAVFDGVRLGEAVRVIARRGGADLVFSTKTPTGAPVRLSFTDIPWRQALDSLLAAFDCAAIPDAGGILRIVTREEADSLLETRSRPLRYIQPAGARFRIGAARNPDDAGRHAADNPDAASLVAMLERVKSAKGALAHEPRANILILRDTPERLRDMLRIVDEMDQPLPQILVEARIVTMEDQTPAGDGAAARAAVPAPAGCGGEKPPGPAGPARRGGSSTTLTQVPGILVLDNEEASICIGGFVPARPGQANAPAGDRFVGIRLLVTPRVCRGTDDIILEAVPQRIGGSAVLWTPEAGGPVHIGVQAMRTRMMLRSGETGRAAGTFREERTSAAGADGKAETRIATTTIFLTATIIPPDADAAFAQQADILRNALAELPK